MLPYGKQSIDKDDIEAVTEVLHSDWLTTGPKVVELEREFAVTTSTQEAVAVNSGTAALHCAMVGAGLGPGDEVIVPAITFVATANAAIYVGAQPVFADVNSETLLIDPDSIRQKITAKTKAIVAMDYGGQPCDYNTLRKIADDYDLTLISDACHSLGGSYAGRPVGSLADFTCFSLHPIKQITAGEGGIVVTNDQEAATRMRSFRNHGITTDFRERQKGSVHCYSMEHLGFNYRITDIQCALGVSQLKKLARFTRRRNDIANFYRTLLEDIPFVRPLEADPNLGHAYHLFVVKWDAAEAGCTRDEAFRQLKSRGIGTNVHYLPVYLHPYYQASFGDQSGTCPVAESAYEQILSIPMYPGLVEAEVRKVVEEIRLVGETVVASRAA